MANETVTVNDLVLDEVSSSLSSQTGEAQDIAAGDTAVITNVQDSDRLFITLNENDGDGTATCVVAAGDNPPAQRQGLGSLTFTVEANIVKVIVLEAARYMKADDTIDIAVTGQNIVISAQRVPHGA